jgi:hypothetical protein
MACLLQCLPLQHGQFWCRYQLVSWPFLVWIIWL